MLIQDLIIPLYCSNCQNVIFVHHPQNSSEVRLLDYFEGGWRQHPCIGILGNAFLEHDDIQNRLKLKWGIEKIPFFKKKDQRTRQLKFSAGIIISLPTKEDKNAFFQVLTLEGNIIDIKIKSVPSDISAGILIDLKAASRVGPGKFRLPELTQLAVPNENDIKAAQPKEYYHLSLSTQNQEQLEVFTSRLTNILLKQKSPPLCLIPLQIETTPQGSIYRRQVTIYSESGFLKKVEKINFPETIQFSFRQIQT